MLYLEDHLERFTDAEVERWMQQLPEQRRRQAEAFRHALGRKQCVLAYRMLCCALQTEYGLSDLPEFEYSKQGKPFLAGHPDIHFNLSHCRQAVACAVSDRPVGVDVESIGRDKPELVEHVMSPREQQTIRSSARPQETFAILWTRKEALLKLTGEGLVDHLAGVLESPLAENVQFDTRVHADQGYVCTMAWEKTGR